MIILETDRLLLRIWTNEDILAIAPLYADEEVMKYCMKGPFNYDQTKDIITARMFEQRIYGFCLWAVCEKETGELIGHAGIEKEEDNSPPVLRVLIAKKCWGKGFGLECSEAIIKYAFDKLKLPFITACAKPKNIFFTRILDKTMKHDKETLHDDDYVTCYIIKSEDEKWKNNSMID